MNNHKNPTHSKTFCDGIDFGSLPDAIRYTQCPRADAIDREEKTLKTHDKKDSLKKMKIN